VSSVEEGDDVDSPAGVLSLPLLGRQALAASLLRGLFTGHFRLALTALGLPLRLEIRLPLQVDGIRQAGLPVKLVREIGVFVEEGNREVGTRVIPPELQQSVLVAAVAATVDAQAARTPFAGPLLSGEGIEAIGRLPGAFIDNLQTGVAVMAPK
jgi:hypothetical protein